MGKMIIIDCKKLSYLGVTRTQTIINEALKKAELDCYVDVNLIDSRDKG